MREPGGRTLAPGTAGPAAHARRPLPAATGTQQSIRSSDPHPAPGHDGALLRPPGRHLHHVLGPHRHRRALVRAQRTQPRSDHHHAGGHRCLLLPLLAHRHLGPAEPPVWAPAEE